MWPESGRLVSVAVRGDYFDGGDPGGSTARISGGLPECA